MKILLVYPYFLSERGKDYDVRPMPIGLYYIGAMLMADKYDVEIINLYNIKGDLNKLKSIFAKRQYDCLGVSLFNGNRFGALDCAKASKEVNPDAKVIFGGVGATFLPEFFLKFFPFVDYIIRGEGEATFKELIEYMKRDMKAAYSLYDIKGLSFRDSDGNIVHTEDRPFLDELDSLHDPSKYFSFQHIISSRGCPWDCSFCGSPAFWKRKVRFHTPEYFVEQMKRLYKKGINFFYVSDDTFTLKKDRVIRICELIIKEGLRVNWYAISRVNCIDKDIAYWMRRAGCIQISYGVESGSKKIRKFFNKAIKDDDIIKAFEITREYGMIPRAYLIYGTPYDTKETIDETVGLIKRCRPLSMVSYVLDIYPGTKLYEDLKKRTGITDDIWLQPIEDIMYFETDINMDAEKVIKTGKEIKGAFYSMLPDFIKSLEFTDIKELYSQYSEICSRLGFSLTHGDYASIDQIPLKQETGEYMFKTALKYYKNPDAYLGLGLIYQKKRDFQSSLAALKEGHELFQDNKDIAIALGITLMNLKKFKKASELFEKFNSNGELEEYLKICYANFS